MPPGIAGAEEGSGLSVMRASVVRIMPAIDAAFSTAERVTFAGSMMPSLEHVAVLLSDHVVADIGVLAIALSAADRLDDNRSVVDRRCWRCHEVALQARGGGC